MAKKIIVTGATGLIGKSLCEKLISNGYEITIFSRSKSKAEKIIPNAAAYVEWDYKNINSFQKNVDGKDAIIHLSGANLGAKRWTENYKKIIYESRIISSRNLVEAIKYAANKPKIFISASAVGFYGEKGDQLITEESSAGNDFLSKICYDWEEAAALSTKYGCRHSAVRTGIVLSLQEGMLNKMITPFKFFVGGPLGNGKQWVPWIHLVDLINLYIFILENEIHGAVNAASPNPVRMNNFADELGNVLNRPSYFRVPKFAIKIAAGEIADFILMSQRVIPKKLKEANFNFNFVDLKNALTDTIKYEK